MSKFRVMATDEGGNPAEVELEVARPTGADMREANLVRGASYRRACDRGLYLREELDQVLRGRKLWDDAKQAAFDAHERTILGGLAALESKKRDGKPLRLSEAREVALDVFFARRDRAAMLAVTDSADRETADYHADQDRFNSLVASCTLRVQPGHNPLDGPAPRIPYFTRDGRTPSAEAYVEAFHDPARAEAASRAAEAFNAIWHGQTEEEAVSAQPEVAFLKKHRFLDADLHLVDKQGRRVDRRGRLVGEDGNYVDEAGRPVDSEGRPVDASGGYVPGEAAYFTDDDGNPLDDDGNPVAAPEDEVADE